MPHLDENDKVKIILQIFNEIIKNKINYEAIVSCDAFMGKDLSYCKLTKDIMHYWEKFTFNGKWKEKKEKKEEDVVKT